MFAITRHKYAQPEIGITVAKLLYRGWWAYRITISFEKVRINLSTVKTIKLATGRK